MPKTPSCCRFASRERFDGFWLGAEPVFHSNTSARRSTGRCTSSPIFLQNTRGTAAFLPEVLARCRFGSEGRFEALSLGTLPVFLRESFGQKNVRQSVLGEKCRKRRLAAVSRLAGVPTEFRWALSLFFIPTPPRGKVPGGALPSPIFCRTSAAPPHFCQKRWLGAVSVGMAVSTCDRRALCPRFYAQASVRDSARRGASGETRQKHGLGDSFGCAGSAGVSLIGALQRFRSRAAQRGKSPRTAFLRSAWSAGV